MTQDQKNNLFEWLTDNMGLSSMDLRQRAMQIVDHVDRYYCPSPDSKEVSWFDALMDTGVTLHGPTDCTDKLVNEYTLIKKQ
jgi:hypothetical protein